jgi:hypothetical protein
MRQEIMKNDASNAKPPGIGISIDALYDIALWEVPPKVAELEMLDAKKFYAEIRYNKQW